MSTAIYIYLILVILAFAVWYTEVVEPKRRARRDIQRLVDEINKRPPYKPEDKS